MHQTGEHACPCTCVIVSPKAGLVLGWEATVVSSSDCTHIWLSVCVLCGYCFRPSRVAEGARCLRSPGSRTAFNALTLP